MSEEIMELRVGPIPQKYNESNHGIAFICLWCFYVLIQDNVLFFPLKHAQNAPQSI